MGVGLLILTVNWGLGGGYRVFVSFCVFFWEWGREVVAWCHLICTYDDLYVLSSCSLFDIFVISINS